MLAGVLPCWGADIGRAGRANGDVLGVLVVSTEGLRGILTGILSAWQVVGLSKSDSCMCSADARSKIFISLRMETSLAEPSQNLS